VKLELKGKSRPKLQRFSSQEPTQLKMRFKVSNTVASNFNLVRQQTDTITRNLSRQNSGNQQHLLRKLYSNDMIGKAQTKVQRTTWRSLKLKKSKERIYIKEYRAGPMELEVSLMKKATFEMSESDILKTISSMGLALNDIDEAPLKQNALYLHNVFGDYDDVVM